MNDREIMEKVLHRAEKIKREKIRKQKVGIVAFISLMLVASFSAVMPSLMAITSAMEPEGESYVGSLLMHNSVMGYVLVGIFALIVGVVATFICCKIRDKEK